MTGSHAQLTFGLGENFMVGGGEGECAEMHSGHGLAGGGDKGTRTETETETNNIFTFLFGNGLFLYLLFYLLQIYFK